jgi:hypothetical protein
VKKSLLPVIALMLYSTGHAQAEKNNLSVAVDFNAISHFGSRMQTGEAFQSYKSAGVSGSPYYSNNWNEGTVTTSSGQQVSGYLLLYDKQAQDLYIRAKDTNLVIKADKSQVKSFSFSSPGKQHNFIHYPLGGKKPVDGFMEVLAPGENFTLLKLTQTIFERADYNDMLKVRNGEVTDAFTDHITYYVLHNNTLIPTPLKEHAVRKALDGLSPKAGAFINAHRNSGFNEQLLINLVTALNQ